MNQLLMKIVIGAFLLVNLPAYGDSGRTEGFSLSHPFPFTRIAETTPDVPYVPTPRNVVSKMLEMADVDEGDVVYDLGSGDGRIVIAAAMERGARGVGIDNDPVRIRESRENAKEANVADRVRFIEQDLFESNLRNASVVTLYLLYSVNQKLRPKLLQELKPGSRVVSQTFSMGEWKPDRSAVVDGYEIFFWVVPANASGSWEWSAAGPEGTERFRLKLNQAFQEVSGSFENGKESMPIEHAKLRGDRLVFSVPQKVNGQSIPVRYEGRIWGNEIEGRRIPGSGVGAAIWKARRDPDTIVPLDGTTVAKK